MRELFKSFIRIDGARFLGHLTNSATVSTLDRPVYRVLHVRRPHFLVVGDIIRAMTGEWIILMDHPDFFDWAETFKVSYVTEILPWTRPTRVDDPVARVARNVVDESMGDLYVNFDTPEELKVEGLNETGYRFITGQAVKVGDHVGDKTIKRIVPIHGVKAVFCV